MGVWLWLGFRWTLLERKLGEIVVLRKLGAGC